MLEAGILPDPNFSRRTFMYLRLGRSPGWFLVTAVAFVTDPNMNQILDMTCTHPGLPGIGRV
jgi:hypothetical protein